MCLGPEPKPDAEQKRNMTLDISSSVNLDHLLERSVTFIQTLQWRPPQHDT